MSHESVKLEHHGPVAVIRFARPQVHNAVDAGVMDGLEAVCDELDAAGEGVRAVVLTGTGERTFCAGADLAWAASLDSPAAGGAMSRRMQGILDRLTGGPRPVIAALNGDVLGGGCEIALACHLRIAGADVRFAFRPAALGIVTGWGGGARLFRLVGRGAALRLLLGAETIDAEEALRLGLVERLAPRERVVEEAIAWAERLAAQSPASIAAFLELDRALLDGDPAAVVATERRLFADLWQGDAFQGVLADWRRRAKTKK